MYKFGVFFSRIAFAFLLTSYMVLSVFSAPSLSASSAILINADSGEVIAEYNADTRRGMASTTKIMTAILAIESGNLDQIIKIPKEAVGVEGSSLYLKEGESMSLLQLVTGLLLQSANDAAEAIAITVGGGIEGFAELMNQKAATLGLKNTHFTNPHGLSDDNHFTTARELSKIAAYALKNPIFKNICSMKKATLAGGRVVVNHNKLLSLYSGAYGVKTGFTKATGRCLVSAAAKDGVNLVAVTLNAPNDWNDHISLFDFGFSIYESVLLKSGGDIAYDIPILNGERDSVSLYVKEDITACIKKNRGSIIERLEINRPRFAPVYADDILGKIVFILDGKIIAEEPLYAKEYIGQK